MSRFIEVGARSIELAPLNEVAARSVFWAQRVNPWKMVSMRATVASDQRRLAATPVAPTKTSSDRSVQGERRDCGLIVGGRTALGLADGHGVIQPRRFVTGMWDPGYIPKSGLHQGGKAHGLSIVG